MDNSQPRSGDREKWLYRGTQIVWYALGIIEAFLFLRLMLRLLEANTTAGFTNFVYSVSGFFDAPFRFVFPSVSPDVGNVFEWSTLLAMLIYWLAALALIRLFGMSRRISGEEARARLDKEV